MLLRCCHYLVVLLVDRFGQDFVGLAYAFCSRITPSIKIKPLNSIFLTIPWINSSVNKTWNDVWFGYSLVLYTFKNIAEFSFFFTFRLFSFYHTAKSLSQCSFRIPKHVLSNGWNRSVECGGNLVIDMFSDFAFSIKCTWGIQSYIV